MLEAALADVDLDGCGGVEVIDDDSLPLASLTSTRPDSPQDQQAVRRGPTAAAASADLDGCHGCVEVTDEDSLPLADLTGACPSQAPPLAAAAVDLDGRGGVEVTDDDSLPLASLASTCPSEEVALVTPARTKSSARPRDSASDDDDILLAALLDAKGAAGRKDRERHPDASATEDDDLPIMKLARAASEVQKASSPASYCSSSLPPTSELLGSLSACSATTSPCAALDSESKSASSAASSSSSSSSSSPSLPSPSAASSSSTPSASSTPSSSSGAVEGVAPDAVDRGARSNGEEEVVEGVVDA